jgi:hypothetical protein
MNYRANVQFAADGIKGGGTARVYKWGEDIGQGGVRGGGTAKFNWFVYRTASGGAVCGGAARLLSRTFDIGRGGAVCGGTARFGVITRRFASGGAVCGGTAIQALTSDNGVVSGSGGVRGGGTARNIEIMFRTASGGVVCAGTAQIRKVSPLIATGGAVVNGFSLSEVRIYGKGGAVLGGVATNHHFMIGSVSGGIAAGDSARTHDFTAPVFVVCHQDKEGMCCKRPPSKRAIKVTDLEITNRLADGYVAASVVCILRKRFGLGNKTYSNSDKFRKRKLPPQRLRNTQTYTA